MNDTPWAAVDRYASELLVRPAEALVAALEASEAAGIPPISVSAAQGKFLMLLAQSMGARRILEIGTLGGYSAIWLAQALPPGGYLLSLEVNAAHASVARDNLARAGFSAVAEVRVGPALETLTAIAASGGAPVRLDFHRRR
jgi:predicted O-methyltransferase YrrM